MSLWWTYFDSVNIDELSDTSKKVLRCLRATRTYVEENEKAPGVTRLENCHYILNQLNIIRVELSFQGQKWLNRERKVQDALNSVRNIMVTLRPDVLLRSLENREHLLAAIKYILSAFNKEEVKDMLRRSERPEPNRDVLDLLFRLQLCIQSEEFHDITYYELARLAMDSHNIFDEIPSLKKEFHCFSYLQCCFVNLAADFVSTYIRLFNNNLANFQAVIETKGWKIPTPSELLQLANELKDLFRG